MLAESINIILSHYEIGILISNHYLSVDATQEKIPLNTGKGKFVLKHYKSESVKFAHFDLLLLELLNKRSFCSPLIQRTRNRELFYKYKNEVIAIYQYIEGEHKHVLTDFKEKDKIDQLNRLGREKFRKKLN